jgi:uncharacterized protein (DUF433 family)
MIDWSTCPAVERDESRLSGAWVFKGLRVPVSALFENLEDDASLHEFIEWFPGVTQEQARTVLDHAARNALAAAQVRVLPDASTRHDIGAGPAP